MKTDFAFFLVITAAFTAKAAQPDPVVPHFHAVDVDTHVGIGYGVAVADVDGDKKPDILLVDKDVVVWYQNPSWKKHIMVEKLTPADHVCIAAADIDGDGKAEVAVGAGWRPSDTVNSGAVFYLIPPADRTQKWEPVQLHHEPTVHRMRWVKNDEGKFDLVVVPLHGKGNKNGQGEGVKILAYHMPKNPKDPWTTTLLNNSFHLTHNFHPVSWDADHDATKGQKLLIAGKEGVFLLERSGAENRLTQLGGNGPGETAFPGAGEVRDGKLPSGKRFLATVEPMHGTNAVIYTQTSEPGLWNRNVIDPSLFDGHAVACGDLLQAGYDQVVVGWRAMDKPGAKVGIKLFVPLDKDGKKWQQTLIDDNTMACEDLILVDLDGDGRLDIIAAGRGTHNLKVYFNHRHGAN